MCTCLSDLNTNYMGLFFFEINYIGLGKEKVALRMLLHVAYSFSKNLVAHFIYTFFDIVF